MTKNDRLALQTAQAVLEPHGFICSLQHGRKHHSVRIEKDGVVSKISYVCTPRTPNVENWTRQAARRALRDWPHFRG